MTLSYDVLVCTKNRQDVLNVSLPQILSQSRPPQKVVVIDASDDTNATQTILEGIFASCSIHYQYIKSDRANLPYQRNLGLKFIEAPVVMLPDDDSIWFPGVAEGIMRVYERDSTGVIGGVCAADSHVSPLSEGETKIYKKMIGDRIKRRLEPLRRRIESIFFPNPWYVFSFDKAHTLPQLDWLPEEKALLVEVFSGFRMTFRTDLIREVGFDDTLGSFVGYGTHEDMDVCLGIISKGKLLVGTHNAYVYHHKHPSARAGGFVYGFIHVLNFLYISRKYLVKDPRYWKLIFRFQRYKRFLYSLRRNDAYGKDRYDGALLAWQHRDTILNSPVDALKDAYKEMCDTHLVPRRNK